MTFVDLRKQLELELEWREKEVKLLYNLLSRAKDEDDRKACGKALLVMLYSHFEGFCNIAFSIYIDILNAEKINGENIKCSQVNKNIAAISLDEIFKAIKDPNVNCSFFAGSAPNEKWKHFYRRVYFLTEINNLFDQPIKLKEEFISTKSNLKVPILSMILYHLGFPPDRFNDYTTDISNMVDRRNDYAHGEKKTGIKIEEYERFEVATFRLMNELMELLDDSLNNKLYLIV